MNTIRTTRITVETETLTVVHRAVVERAWCPACDRETDVIRISHKNLSDVESPELRRLADAGRLHTLQTGSDLVQVCLPSLLQCFEFEEADRLRSWKLEE